MPMQNEIWTFGKNIDINTSIKLTNFISGEFENTEYKDVY